MKAIIFYYNRVWGISPGCVSPIFLKACGVLKNVAFHQVAFRQIENY